MKEEIKNLALYRLSRSEESFNDGEILFRNNSLNSAVNRYYYAAFYAAKSLLATQELDSSKHSGVISLFQQKFVKTGIIPIDVSKALPRSFEERIDTDYCTVTKVIEIPNHPPKTNAGLDSYPNPH